MHALGLLYVLFLTVIAGNELYKNESLNLKRVTRSVIMKLVIHVCLDRLSRQWCPRVVVCLLHGKMRENVTVRRNHGIAKGIHCTEILFLLYIKHFISSLEKPVLTVSWACLFKFVPLKIHF